MRLHQLPVRNGIHHHQGCTRQRSCSPPASVTYPRPTQNRCLNYEVSRYFQLFYKFIPYVSSLRNRTCHRKYRDFVHQQSYIAEGKSLSEGLIKHSCSWNTHQVESMFKKRKEVTLPKINIAPENRQSQKGNVHLSTINFEWLCFQFSGRVTFLLE